ncbi:hypothetical protein PXH59_14520 [Xenorhabdus sp. SF857]|uniref:hypothetical protein n=1 Tax=Xenorhabdus bakwenae TaxID=3026967 RepID=UPI002557D6DE|nr:hypothetical protein [Xenorhabdus sp. SF857]WFQ78855.1 hypothetical protein PXH59_14520 [Xenorhabdus sp. SF857]
MTKDEKVLFLFEQTIKAIDMHYGSDTTSLNNIEFHFNRYYSSLESLLDQKLLESNIKVK